MTEDLITVKDQSPVVYAINGKPRKAFIYKCNSNESIVLHNFIVLISVHILSARRLIRFKAHK